MTDALQELRQLSKNIRSRTMTVVAAHRKIQRLVVVSGTAAVRRLILLGSKPNDFNRPLKYRCQLLISHAAAIHFLVVLTVWLTEPMNFIFCLNPIIYQSNPQSYRYHRIF